MIFGQPNEAVLQAQLKTCPKWPTKGARACRAPIKAALKSARVTRKIGIPLPTGNSAKIGLTVAAGLAALMLFVRLS